MEKMLKEMAQGFNPDTLAAIADAAELRHNIALNHARELGFDEGMELAGKADCFQTLAVSCRKVIALMGEG